MLLQIALQAQNIERYNTFSYNVNEGLLQSTMSDMEFDSNNFCWISFPNGIQKFDGKIFTRIPVQPGLPEDKFAYFFRCKNGDLLISHARGISKYDIHVNRFRHIYDIPVSINRPPIFIGEDDGIVYFYTEPATIAGINCKTFEVAGETKTGLPVFPFNTGLRPKVSSNIIDHRVALGVNAVIYLWDLKAKRLVTKSDSIPGLSAYLLFLNSANEVFHYKYTMKEKIGKYNFSTKEFTEVGVKQNDGKSVGRCIIYPWKNKMLISFSNKLYEVDEGYRKLTTELVNFQNQPVGGLSPIARIREDNFGNLYLCTVTDGFKKVIRNNYPIKYYGTEKKEDNFILSILPDKQSNRILVGATSGLFIFDTLQRLTRHIRFLPNTPTYFAPNCMIKNTNGDYIIFAGSQKNAWVLKHDLSGFNKLNFSTSLPESETGIQYFGNFLFQDDKEAVVQSQGRVYRTIFASNNVKEHKIADAYTMSGIHYKDLVITHSNDELIFLDLATFKEVKKIPFKNTGYVRCFAKDTTNNIFIGSNKGIFKIDVTGKILMHLTKESGLPDECIYAMVFDNSGTLWCSSNKGIFKVNKDNSILQLKKEDGLQENEFNTNTVAKTSDDEIFFGGVNGVSSFYPSKINSLEEKINLLVTGINVNNKELFKDTSVWNINKVDLDYDQNSLSFDFIAMANNNPGQYIYQYRMQDVDEQWIQNTDMQTVRYFLPPGKYVFQLYASRFFDKDAKPMKEITIHIHPPMWKTWWFRILAGIFLVSILAYGINQFNRRKFQKKLSELEAEHKIRLERERISRDLHDSIGAYANAVLYNTELLETEKETKLRAELMKDLKFASKDIITSLRETIWALKKDNYTAEDCVLRIRNFIQPLTRYYHHIKFVIEGGVPSERSLHYTKALNLVRIVQEAVTNAIKHTTVTQIEIMSNIKEGQWEMVVTDNGEGFDTERLHDSSPGNGLNNMKQRAADAGFELTIRSWQGRGTSVSIRVT